MQVIITSTHHSSPSFSGGFYSRFLGRQLSFSYLYRFMLLVARKDTFP